MEDQGEATKKTRWFRIIVIGLVGAFATLAIFGALVDYLDPEGAARRKAEENARNVAEALEAMERFQAERTAKIESAPKITAIELSQRYKANEVAAQSLFGNRPLVVSGKVTGIRLDYMDRPVVELQSVDRYTGVQARMTSSTSAARLSKGEEVRFFCQSVSEILGVPQLSECEPV